MNEERLQKLYNDLGIADYEVGFDEFKKGMATNREFFDQMHVSARNYYGGGRVPEHNEFAQDLGITYPEAPEQPNVRQAGGMFSELGASLYETGKYSIPSAIDTWDAAGEGQLSERYLDIYEQIKDLPDDQEIEVDNPAFQQLTDRTTTNMAVAPGGMPMFGNYQKAAKVKARAGDIKRLFSAKGDELAQGAADLFDSAIERMREKPVVVGRIDEWSKADPRYNSMSNFGKFFGYQMGQAVSYMFAAGVAPGVGGQVLEAGNIHLDAMEQIKAENPELSTKDIIEKRMLDYEQGEFYGALAAGIDLISLGTIAKIAGIARGKELIEQGTKQLTKRQIAKQTGKAMLKGGAVEAPTEYIQEKLAGAGTAAEIGKEYVPDPERENTAFFAGLFPGMVFGGGGKFLTSTRDKIFNKGDNIPDDVKERVKTIVNDIDEELGDVMDDLNTPNDDIEQTLNEQNKKIEELALGIKKDVEEAGTQETVTITEEDETTTKTTPAKKTKKPTGKQTTTKKTTVPKKGKKTAAKKAVATKKPATKAKSAAKKPTTKAKPAAKKVTTKPAATKTKKTPAKASKKPAKVTKPKKGATTQEQATKPQKLSKQESQERAQIMYDMVQRADKDYNNKLEDKNNRDKDKTTGKSAQMVEVDGKSAGITLERVKDGYRITKPAKNKKGSVTRSYKSRAKAKAALTKLLNESVLPKARVEKPTATEKRGPAKDLTPEKQKPKGKRPKSSPAVKPARQGRRTNRVTTGLVKDTSISDQARADIKNRVMKTIKEGKARFDDTKGDTTLKELQALRNQDDRARKEGKPLLSDKDRRYVDTLLDSPRDRKHYNQYSRFGKTTTTFVEEGVKPDLAARARNAKSETATKSAADDASIEIDNLNNQVDRTNRDISKVRNIVQNVLDTAEVNEVKLDDKLNKKFNDFMDSTDKEMVDNMSNTQLKTYAKRKGNRLQKLAKEELDKRETARKEAQGEYTARGIAAKSPEERRALAKRKYKELRRAFDNLVEPIMQKIATLEFKLEAGTIDNQRTAFAEKQLDVLKDNLNDAIADMEHWIKKPNMRGALSKRAGFPLAVRSPITLKDFRKQVAKMQEKNSELTASQRSKIWTSMAGKKAKGETMGKTAAKKSADKMATQEAAEDAMVRLGTNPSGPGAPTEARVRKTLKQSELDKIKNIKAAVREAYPDVAIEDIISGSNAGPWIVVRTKAGNRVLVSQALNTKKVNIAGPKETLIKKVPKKIATLLEKRDKAVEGKPTVRFAEKTDDDLSKTGEFRPVLKYLNKVLKPFGITMNAYRVTGLERLDANGNYKSVQGTVYLREGNDLVAYMQKNFDPRTDSYRFLHETMHLLSSASKAVKAMGYDNKSIFDTKIRNIVEGNFRKVVYEIQKEVANLKAGKKPNNPLLLNALKDYMSLRVEFDLSETEGVILDTVDENLAVRSGNIPISEERRLGNLRDEQASKFLDKNIKKILKSEAFSEFLSDVENFTFADEVKHGPDQIYGLTSMEEFMSEMFNVHFARILDAIPSDKPVKLGKKPRSTLLGQLLDTMITYIKEVLPRGFKAKDNTVYAEVINAFDDAFVDLETERTLKEDLKLLGELQNEGQDLDVEVTDIVAPTDEQVKKIITNKVTKYITNNFPILTKKSTLSKIINKINKDLPKGSQIDKAMANAIIREVRGLNGREKSKILADILSKKTQGKKQGKKIKVGKYVGPEVGAILRELREASQGQTTDVEGALNALDVLNQQLQHSPLTPEQYMEYLKHSVIAFEKLNDSAQESLINGLNELVEDGRNKFLETQKNRAKKAQTNQELLINKMYGIDGKAKEKQYKVKNPYAEYKKGDKVVIFTNNILKLVRVEEDMKGSDIKLKNENVTELRTLQGVGVKKQVTGVGNKFLKFWDTIRLDGLLGLDGVVDIIMGNSQTIEKQYRSEAASRLTDPLREAGVREIMNMQQASMVLVQGKEQILGEGSATKAIKRSRELYQKKLTDKQLNDLNEKHNGLFVNSDERLGTILKRWMELFASDVRDAYQRQNIDPTSLQEDLANILPEWAKRWGKWQLSFYNQMYERINPVYKNVYGTDLDRVDFYSPLVSLAGNKKAKNRVDYVANMLQGYDPTGTASKEVQANEFRERRGSIPQSVQADDVLVSFIRKMEHFIAFAEPLSNITTSFNNEAVRGTIVSKFGEKYVDLIDKHIQGLANGRMGVDEKELRTVLERMRNAYSLQALALNLTLLPKQLASFPAYLSNVEAKDYPKYFAYLSEGLAKTAAMQKDNPFSLFMKEDWIKARHTGGFDADVAFRNATGAIASFGSMTDVRNFAATADQAHKAALNLAMFPTKMGDIGAIILGGYPMYRIEKAKYVKKGLSLEEAHKKAMFDVSKASSLSQQSGLGMDLGKIQKGGVLGRLFTQFMTSPIQYRRQVGVAYSRYTSAVKTHGRYSKQAKAAGANFLKRVAIFHVGLPMLFSFVSAGFYPPMDEEGEINWEALMVEALLGSSIGIPIAGPGMRFVLDTMLKGKAYPYEAAPVFGMLAEIWTSLAQVEGEKISEALKDVDSVPSAADALVASFKELSDLTDVGVRALGIPTKPVRTIVENVEKMQTPYGRNNYTDWQKALLYAGYSEYAVPQLRTKDASGKPIDWRRMKRQK